ncbi:tripartite tricarboxylate transporter substrate-binding protein [Virgibacillus sp. C22-A2]|uniref:Tripartite tricarboxylate transporter substrate-binding protein n=1 Tax=Virgibacillus tibetensis TaxID=3042313 RepID=A0ABU6KDB9_9BACI|nr:tripartite tricarboxylate transporter substrate-binding protein [Virgibacillus sp. C22-A2]
MKHILGFILILTVFITGCSDNTSGSETVEGEDWSPEQSIEIVAPSGAGGGWDTTARMAAKILEEEDIIGQDIGVVNKTGGGGAVGWSYIAGREGSPYNLFVTSPPIIDVPLNGNSEYNHEDFTPIANVIADYGAFAVRADADWDTLPELFDDMLEDPSGITVIGSSSPGSMDHLKFVRFAKAYGVDVQKIKYVSEQDGGELTALLNGSVDVFSTSVAQTVEQVKAGEIKVLAITSEERLEGDVLSDFETAIEQGINETYINWRGFMGPADLDEEVVAYYEEAFRQMNESDAWADVRSQYGWGDMFLDSKEFKAFLDEEKKETEILLQELGLSE